MDRHEQRVRRAQVEFLVVAKCAGPRESKEDARMDLRRAVILQEANTWHGAGKAGGA